MITDKGFSKDKFILPQSIAITFGREMMKEHGGPKQFLTYFLETMETDGDEYWMHKCSNLPTKDIDHVYIIVMNRLWGRVYCGGYKRPVGGQECHKANGDVEMIEWPHITLAGPFERCPFKRELKGFQGFRYTTKLF